jgi:two-component sensor histidine kinase/ActR/RegA family two-component response regulator
MALPLSRDLPNYLLLFRRELVRTVNWAGDPTKPLSALPGADRLSPRKSFALWQETVRRQSQPWESHDRLTAEALRTALLEVVLKYSELVALERAKSENQQRFHAAELNHRIKNALALIGALVSSSTGQDHALDSFVSDLKGRIESLARANDLAANSGPIELRRLIETELAPFASPHRRFDIKGPEVLLASHAGRVVALVVHEMTTNAAKHGALSVPTGRLAVRWRVDQAGACRIKWIERDGPKIAQRGAEGFGSFLIRNQIPFELNGNSQIRSTPEGVEITLHLPAECVFRSSSQSKPRRREGSRDSGQAGGLSGGRILVVEDSLILAHEIERELRKNGALDVILCGSLGSALEAAETLDLAGAVLDIDLKGQTSYPVANALAGRGVPFIFVTGYGMTATLPERFRDISVVSKPINAVDLVKVLAAATRSARSRRLPLERRKPRPKKRPAPGS